MATKRDVRAASMNLEKATKELAECKDADQKGAKHRLENELAEAKRMMHLGKKEHVDVERLGLSMGSARLVLKMYGKVETSQRKESEETAVVQSTVQTTKRSEDQSKLESVSLSYVTGATGRGDPSRNVLFSSLGLGSTQNGPIIELPNSPLITGEPHCPAIGFGPPKLIL